MWSFNGSDRTILFVILVKLTYISFFLYKHTHRKCNFHEYGHSFTANVTSIADYATKIVVQLWYLFKMLQYKFFGPGWILMIENDWAHVKFVRLWEKKTIRWVPFILSIHICTDIHLLSETTCQLSVPF